jgi:hypothetical protein
MQIDGPAGTYEIRVLFEKDTAPVGGRGYFIVSDAKDLPKIDAQVTLWGDEELLGAWLRKQGIECRSFLDTDPGKREIILVGGLSEQPRDLSDWRKLLRRVYRGSVAVFLTPKVFKRGDDQLGWLPFSEKGSISRSSTWAPGSDSFVKDHSIFDGLPRRGLLDLVFYRDLLPEQSFDGQELPKEIVAGVFGVGYYPTKDRSGYYSGIHIGVYDCGAGRFIINSLLLLENLGKHPASDRLVLNMIRYASRFTADPTLPLSPDASEKILATYPQ